MLVAESECDVRTVIVGRLKVDQIFRAVLVTERWFGALRTKRAVDWELDFLWISLMINHAPRILTFFICLYILPIRSLLIKINILYFAQRMMHTHNHTCMYFIYYFWTFLLYSIQDFKEIASKVKSSTHEIMTASLN